MNNLYHSNCLIKADTGKFFISNVSLMTQEKIDGYNDWFKYLPWGEIIPEEYKGDMLFLNMYKHNAWQSFDLFIESESIETAEKSLNVRMEIIEKYIKGRIEEVGENWYKK